MFKLSRFRCPPELSKFESPGFKSLQMLLNGPFIFRQGKVHIDFDFMVLPGLKQCLPGIVLCKVPRLQMLNFLVRLNVGDCSHCSDLPPLGQLPCLKYLTIEKMNGVKRIGLELYGIGYSTIKPFQSLEILCFREMLEWQEWIFGEVVGVEFPRLQELYIQRCPKLKWSLPKYISPSTIKVEVSACPNLVIPNKDHQWSRHNPPIPVIVDDLLRVDSNMVQLKSNEEIASESSENDTDMSNMSDSDTDNDPEESELERMEVSEYLGLTDLPPLLYTLTIEGCVDLVSLPEKLTREHRYLRNLIIINCCYLESFHGGHPPTALEILYIHNCRKLEFISPATTKLKNSLLQYLCIQSSCDSLRFLPLDRFPKLKTLTIWDCANLSFILTEKDHMSLQKLLIQDCPKLISFPKGGLRTPNLVSILLSNCKNLKGLPDQLHKLTSLLKLDIRECLELESIPEGCLPCNLYSLRIISCEKLTPRTQWGMCKLKDLVYFEIEGGCRDLESFPDQNLLPSSINQLRIRRLQDLQFLDYRGLEQLKSLEILVISNCKWLRSLPDDCLSSSLTSLHINDCPLLKSNFRNNIVEKKRWFGVYHIRQVQIDDEVIS